MEGAQACGWYNEAVQVVANIDRNNQQQQEQDLQGLMHGIEGLTGQLIGEYNRHKKKKRKPATYNQNPPKPSSPPAKKKRKNQQVKPTKYSPKPPPKKKSPPPKRRPPTKKKKCSPGSEWDPEYGVCRQYGPKD